MPIASGVAAVGRNDPGSARGLTDPEVLDHRLRMEPSRARGRPTLASARRTFFSALGPGGRSLQLHVARCAVAVLLGFHAAWLREGMSCSSLLMPGGGEAAVEWAAALRGPR
jgi:hypothetical protein